MTEAQLLGLSGLALAGSAFIACWARRGVLPFLSIFLISCTYYGLIGPLYWLYYKYGRFAGINWGDLIPLASLIVCLSAFLVTLTVTVLSGAVQTGHADRIGDGSSPLLRPLLALSLTAASLVILTSGNRGGLFLIAYQFSDLAIPCIIYLVASQKRAGVRLWMLAFLFFIYTIFVGFRYKTVLLAMPLLLIFMSNRSKAFQVGTAAISAPALVAGLSLMTFLRVKFSGINLEGAQSISIDQALYGLFAESNIIFGMCSIIENYIDKNVIIWLTPLADSILELIPRAIFNDRVTGERIYVVLGGLVTNEGYNSATTYPFVGEMAMMGGYVGVVLGSIIAGAFIVWLHALTSKYSQSSRLRSGGIGLLAVTFGYYFVSRGYMPQFFKALVFVIAPYIFLLRTTRRQSS